MKKLLTLLLVVSFIFTGCASKDANPVDAKTGEETTAKKDVTYVKVSPIIVKDFTQKLSLPGTLEPKETVVITPKINGSVEGIYGDIGSKIKKDTLLCKLSDTEFRLQYENAEISLKKEKLTYESIKRNYDRYKSLFESGALSQADFESSEDQYALGQELLNLAQNNYELAKQNLVYTNIKAPISGVISQKDVAIGENVSPGKMLFTIVNVDEIYVETGISERDIPNIKVGQKVVVKVDSMGEMVLEGQITHIGPVPDQQTKAYPIKVLIKNKDQVLKPGMFATVEILLDVHKEAMAVPKSAILTENDKQFIFIERDGKAYKKLVKTGYKDNDDWEIIEGIEKDAKVIVVGKDKLMDGNPVEIRE
ncbi:RND family efflux transporter MFP subunit [Anaerosolibacter carboniphilus]|uniref:RND family efflux transporter MFP subunit n=1 Tax=Anaerosolibacter carboniphilus TaxID=1417629 RepID=A0A841L2J5_9FIRM|nr:efflux RND transporter periplasmic adaptor subunit [Anaerosolibacter carboniphilus]MBB6217382.1 RND family efflux transporter MFP subunit [Anaerosolibacter carboniphilus]